MAGRARGHRLTDKFIAGMKPGDVERDGVIPGLLVRAGVRSRSWELRIERKPKFYGTIGDWADIANPLRAEDARKLALTLIGRHGRKEPVLGPDIKSMSLDTAAPLYVANLRAREKSARSVEYVESGIRRLRRMEPKVSTMTLRELSDDPDILLGVWTKIKKLHPVAAQATARVVRTIYLFIRQDRDQSLPERLPTCRIPIKHVDGAKPVMSPAELPAWNALRLGLNDISKEFHLFGLLSGLRRDNLAELKWADWDHELGIMKMVQKGSKPLMLVLSTPMLECLARAKEAGERLWPTNAETWVFPNRGRRTGHVTGNEREIAMPLRSEGGKTKINISTHVLRRTYASVGGLPEEIVDRLLGHRRRASPVMGSYNIDSAKIEEYRELQERASARLMKAIIAPV